jgi:hypothetical protein
MQTEVSIQVLWPYILQFFCTSFCKVAEFSVHWFCVENWQKSNRTLATIKVIVLSASGDAFCSGVVDDFSIFHRSEMFS